MTINRSTVLLLVLGFGIGWYLAGQNHAPPTPDRPVLSWISRTAKRLLWLAVFLEPVPKVGEQDDRRMVQAHAIGEDGYQRIDNGRAF